MGLRSFQRGILPLVALGGAVAHASAATTVARVDAAPRLSATYLQLWADHAAWPEARWRELFRHFDSLGIRELYVQWSVYDAISYVSPRGTQRAVLETVLGLAGESRISVHLGLAFSSDFWQKAKPGAALRPYLQQQRQRSLATAEEIASRYGAHPAFAGWYIAEEIDDLMWPAGEARLALVEHLAELSAGLARVAAKPVSISGYCGARTEPAQLSAFWSGLLERTAIRTLLFQDGIGVGNLPLSYLRQYLEAVQDATAKNGRTLRVIVEVFRQVDGSFNGRPFRAIPAPFALILPQLQTAAPYSADGLVAFSVPEYLTPFGGAEAQQSYLAYLEWLRATSGAGSGASAAGLE